MPSRDEATASSTPHDAAPPLNVLVIHCHDLGRFVGACGVPTVHTPAIDALAADGVQFSDAFCTAPQCSPSRAALFTGRYPHATGVMGLTHKGWDLATGEQHVAGMLGRAGYFTALTGIHHESRRVPDAEIAAQLGFDHVDTLGSTHYERRAELVADATVSLLEERAADTGRPFYLQAGLLEPHRLQNPAPGRDTMGFTGGYVEPYDSRGVTVPGYLRDDAGTRAEMAELQGAVRYADQAIGRILDSLESTGLAESTVVVLTTDHGLALPGAKGSLRDPGLETVLIWRAPALGWTGGRTVDGLVSNVDVVPTLLDAVGLPVPASLHGRSLAPALSGATWRARTTIAGELTFHDFYDPQRCVRTDRYKLIVHFDECSSHAQAVTQSWRPRSTPVDRRLAGSPDPVELFDLKSDPWELTNLADDPRYADVLDDLRGELRDWMTSTDDPLLHGPVASPRHAESRERVLAD